MQHQRNTKGFTLIELSIGLVIVGAMIGGILVARDMIRASQVRSQTAQIDQLITAANSFKLKYGYLPGDIPYDRAEKLGFPGHTASLRSMGNGIIEGYWGGSYVPVSVSQSGEPVLFWADLSSAGLLKSPFVVVPDARVGSTMHRVGTYYTSSTQNTKDFVIKDILPKAVTGQNDYFYVWSGGFSVTDDNFSSDPNYSDNKNYMSLATVWGIDHGKDKIIADPNFPVAVAYAIDLKIDDGMPQHGKLTTLMLDRWTDGDNADPVWSYGALQGEYWPQSGADYSAYDNNAVNGQNCRSPATGKCAVDTPGVTQGPATHAVSGSKQTCYDNGGVAGKLMEYSLAQKSSSPNCALTIQF